MWHYKVHKLQSLQHGHATLPSILRNILLGTERALTWMGTFFFLMYRLSSNCQILYPDPWKNLWYPQDLHGSSDKFSKTLWSIFSEWYCNMCFHKNELMWVIFCRLFFSRRWWILLLVCIVICIVVVTSCVRVLVWPSLWIGLWVLLQVLLYLLFFSSLGLKPGLNVSKTFRLTILSFRFSLFLWTEWNKSNILVPRWYLNKFWCVFSLFPTSHESFQSGRVY